MIVDINIKRMFRILILPAVISVKMVVKFRKGIMDNSGVVVIPTIKAIIPGNKEMKVKGVRALWASLKVFEVEAMAMHKPLIKKE